MLNSNYVILGAFLSLIGSMSYLIETIQGKVKPNKVTWFMWSVAPLIAFAAELKEGVGIQALMTFMVGFNPLLIFIASFMNKRSDWKLTRFDLLCGIFSLIGLVLWYGTKIGTIAILFSIIGDLFAGLPTFRKSFFVPETENYHIFLFGAVSAAITLLTIKVWVLAQYGFPLYILLANSILIVLIKGKPGKKMQTRTPITS